VLEYIGYLCASLAITSSLIGLLSVFAFRTHIRNWIRKKPEKYPGLTVISPQRGKIDSDNIDAVLKQNYPGAWEVIFVTTKDDASLPQLHHYAQKYKTCKNSNRRRRRSTGGNQGGSTDARKTIIY